MAHLFDPLALAGVTSRNRIGMSPMCTYSCTKRDGVPGPWHLVHYGSRALGGCGVVITEATAVEPDGRISLGDAGIWSDSQVKAWQPVTRFIDDCGAVPVIQLAHAGRKAGTHIPWEGRGPLSDVDGGWTPIGPSPLPFNDDYRTPRELSAEALADAVDTWEAAAHRALAAGFKGVELHMAHGYLLHQFLSPLTNRRTDMYGGGFEGRTRFPLMVARAVRQVWPGELPVFARISCTDWVDGGWTLDDSVDFCRKLKEIGIILVDCSTGGAVPQAKTSPVAANQQAGFQVPFAKRIRAEAKIATAAVGLISEPVHADEIVGKDDADLVLLGRELLRSPHWPLKAAAELGVKLEPPRQYRWAFPD